MKTIRVQASRCYDILIGTSLLDQIGSLTADMLPPCTAAIISDSNVGPLYEKRIQESMENAGFKIISYQFPAGESSKNGETYLKILNFLAENKLTRRDLLIALGGGVTGDMTGFAAATYLRGIPYIQVPTSLLAMVDSSVGGKTAIDLPAGKNLAGAFYQPAMVVCDIDALESLPEEIFRDGCAEVIKYGVLYDEALLDRLINAGTNFPREDVIFRCVELKRNVVAQDEFDTGTRQKLNLGHTFGHGVEACSHFSVSHGKAVAIGMAIAARVSLARGLCSPAVCKKILLALERFHLPCSTAFTARQLYSSALSDKKRSGQTVTLVLPRAIGDCILRPTPVEQLEALIKDGL